MPMPGSHRVHGALVLCDARDLPVCKIHGNIGILLKESDLPFVFHRYSARRDIGHTPVGKLKAGIGDIHAGADHRRTRCLDPLDLEMAPDSE